MPGVKRKQTSDISKKDAKKEAKEPVPARKAPARRASAKRATAKVPAKKPTKTKDKPADKEDNDTKEIKAPKNKKAKVEPPPAPVLHIPLCPLVDLIVFGSGEVGQLGLGPEILEKKKPFVVPGLQNVHVLKLAVGGLHVGVLTQAPDEPSRTSLHTWGCNDQGILGRETPTGPVDLSMSPGLVTALEGKHITDVTTGDFHMLALDYYGRVYVWGTYKDADNFIGFSKGQKSEQSEPILLPDLIGTKVIQIASGYNHSLVLNSRGEVLEWGFVWIGRRISGRNKTGYLKPTRLLFPRTQGFKVPKIVAIHAGGYHSFAVSDDDRVFAWGLNNAGQLGIGDGNANANGEIHDQTTPVEVVALRGMGIVSITGGQHHTVALARDGTVYTCGRGSYGQLGNGQTNRVPTFQPLNDFVEDDADVVVKIGAGDTHSLAVTKNGSLYAWGFNERYQLGTNEDQDENEPRKIPFKSYEILAAGGGGQHTTLLGKKKVAPPPPPPPPQTA